jgi:hypothetical protein
MALRKVKWNQVVKLTTALKTVASGEFARLCENDTLCWVPNVKKAFQIKVDAVNSPA